MCGALLVMLACLWHPSPSDATDEGADGMAAVDQFLESQLRDAAVPGGAVVVVRGDRIVHARGFGRADAEGTPVTEHTPFVIGSVSKSFTALGVMQLVEQGRLELDAPVQRYLPWFRVADAEASSQLTVEMLLTHTSGISTADGVNPLRGPISTLDGQVRALSTVTTDPAPSRFVYSNANYQVLGSIIESVSGQPYEEYIRHNIFEPLEMRSSFTSLDEASGAGLSDGHRLFFGMSRPGQPFYRPDFLPAGWLVSSAQDLGHYLIAQLNEGRFRGRQLVSAEAIIQMHQGTTAVPGPGETYYGMGWFSGNRNGLNGVWHSGSNGADMHAVVILFPRATAPSACCSMRTARCTSSSRSSTRSPGEWPQLSRTRLQEGPWK